MNTSPTVRPHLRLDNVMVFVPVHPTTQPTRDECARVLPPHWVLYQTPTGEWRAHHINHQKPQE